MKKLYLPTTFLLMLLGVIFFSSEKIMAQVKPMDKKMPDCINCHNRSDVMPGLFKQYLKSKHFQNNVTCNDCHGATEGEADAFEHEGYLVSVIVTPKDCGKCHQKAVKEFNQSAHHDARTLITTGVGDYFLNNLIGSQFLPDSVKYAGGTNGCWQCHGSEIKMNQNGHPTADTWPNSGIGRKNPDGSFGNCAACHERHEFSVAQARQPESCSICHNGGGGDPQYETYNTSRHGTTYHAKTDQMNLNSDEWIVGHDYFAAPTCATCHISAIRKDNPTTPNINEAIPVTHNINIRLDWSELLQNSNTMAVEEKCGSLLPITGYKQPPPNLKHQENMEQVCIACHSKGLVKNFNAQYESGVKLFLEKWLKPGKELFRLATLVLKAVEKDKYQFFTHPVDFTWWNMCNTSAKNAHMGAAMMSPGQVEIGNGGFVSSWYTGLIPQIKDIIKKHKEDKNPQVNQAVVELQDYFENNIHNNPVYIGPWGGRKGVKAHKSNTTY